LRASGGTIPPHPWGGGVEVDTMYDYDIPRFIGPMPESWSSDVPWNDPLGAPYRCSWCGTRPTWKIASGAPECWDCWYWRKLDGPAARYWQRVASEFLCRYDLYDRMDFFPKCGLSNEEAGAMVKGVLRLLEASELMLLEHGGTPHIPGQRQPS